AHRRRAGAVRLGLDPKMWWRSAYAASRAEAMVRAHDQRAADVISQAGGRIGDHRYAQGVLLRARGLHEGDETHLRHALSLFEEIGCPYQAARTGWLLGGEARKQAERTFTSLGATLPPD